MNLLCSHTYLLFTQGQILCTDFCNFNKRTIAIYTVFFEMQEEFKASKQKQPMGFAQGCVVCLWIEAGERSMPTNMSNKEQWRKERDITWMCIQIFTIITHIWKWFFRYDSRDNRKVVNLIKYEREREREREGERCSKNWQTEFGLLSFLQQHHLHDIDEQSSDVPHVYKETCETMKRWASKKHTPSSS
jgi:hypothetical protein